MREKEPTGICVPHVPVLREKMVLLSPPFRSVRSGLKYRKCGMSSNICGGQISLPRDDGLVSRLYLPEGEVLDFDNNVTFRRILLLNR